MHGAVGQTLQFLLIVGIVLQWNMTLSKSHAKISTYQIFGYKERSGPLQGNEWKKVCKPLICCTIE